MVSSTLVVKERIYKCEGEVKCMWLFCITGIICLTVLVGYGMSIYADKTDGIFMENTRKRLSKVEDELWRLKKIVEEREDK